MTVILAYADRFSARPGEEITLHVSVEGAPSFKGELVRLICGDRNPAGPGFKCEAIASDLAGSYQAEHQAIAIGSYVIVPPQPTLDTKSEMTVSVLCLPSNVGSRPQGLISRWSDATKSGWALILDEENRPALLIGDGSGSVQKVTLQKAILPAWSHITATISSVTKSVTLRRTPLKGKDWNDITQSDFASASLERDWQCVPQEPVLFGALSTGASGASNRPGVFACFTGKLEKPRLLNRALSEAEEGLLQLTGLSDRLATSAIGWWNFEDRLQGDEVIDHSRARHHGKTVNQPARAVTGSTWNGTVRRWTTDPTQYGAIHFHADDMIDARWKPSVTFRLPENLKSGIYAAKLSAGSYEDYVPIFVRPDGDAKRNDLLFVVPTASYLAYSNWANDAFIPVAEQVIGHTVVLGPHDVIIANHPGMGLSLYERHLDGSGVMYAGRRRPILNMRPDYICPHGTYGSPVWQFSGDLHIIDWFESTGIGYDIITDEDIHKEGAAALAGYRIVMTGAHPEYHSDEQLDAFQHYVDTGGRLFYTGGNGFYWRVSYHPDDTGIIELRRAEAGWRAWTCPPGDYYDGFTGNYGGLWLNIGRASSRLTGLLHSAAGMDVCGHFERLPDSFNERADFIFKGVGSTEKIGDFGLRGNGAAGIEIDRFDPDADAPAHTLNLAVSMNIPSTYTGAPEMFPGNVRNTSAQMSAKVAANIVFYETPAGGAVFSTGSIAWAGSLFHNRYKNNVSQITENVLRRFLDPQPFRMPESR